MANTINTGDTITARFITDSNLIVRALVMVRNGDWVIVNFEGKSYRKKVKRNHRGEEYVMVMGTYSMAPIFMAE